ncbi:polysaccharide deacetylase family protein [Pedobacter sp. MC2016-14]|uniref:polysaccharide deacetylase family protein n=1 Tax=Pedobacter sp. MC2016-14 TaxID=2897327 RepID=UPI001E4FA5E9|nr:polysaccharide deacetylase family protein [Pedobacter sp. MC2016-14]MCD0486892.1 polysaccharide deacetylase family protein [Pedobacter sp. MC2016-14]
MLKAIKSFVYSGGLLLGKLLYHNRKSKVLYYHDVHQDQEIAETPMSTPMRLFAQHVAIIRENGFEIVDVITQAKNQIQISFDDGYAGVYKNRHFFIQQGLKPTIFLITASIGTEKYMTVQEIRKLQAEGFRFQSHTHTHPDLNLLNIPQLQQEFSTSKDLLENILEQPVTEICFPKGFFNDKAVNTAFQQGYTALYSSIPGYHQEKNQFKVQYRNLVQFASPFNLKCILLGGLDIYKKRYTQQHYHEQ